MKLTLKFLVKSFIVIVTLLFLLPMLISHFDSAEEEKATALRKRADEARRQIKKKDLGFRDDLARLKSQLKEFPNVQKFGVENPLDQLQVPDPKFKDQLHSQNLQQGQIQEPEKTFGPKAEFRQGILGNYEPDIPKKSGPGEAGEAVYISMEERDAGQRSVKEFGFNMVASDKVAMDRTIPDTRIDECKYWNYPERMPNASVIIVFHNEGWSTLLRTVHSVINMSPKHLLHEVIMVDDFSDKPHLKTRLEDYLKQFNGLVKLFRNKDRVGLIGTRTLGAKYSTGDVILFLDAHCECNKNWLPPLLARIAYDRTTMAVPIIDGIDWDNFAYRPVYGHNKHFRGIFEWGFLYKESEVPQKELDRREHFSEPYRAPTHAGGLFAMDRKYFFELGAYDPGLQIWGGENFELSFKIWQCGGSIEWVPCSRVGHVYRNAMPYGFGKINPKIPVVLLNYMRVVEVWLDDEHKEYFYTREPTIRGYPIGDITEQLAFKKAHNCKSFKWFLENIAYEVLDKFPAPPPNKAWGEIKQKNGVSCWDTMGQGVNGGHIGISACHHFGGNQLQRLNTNGQMAVGERCLDAAGDGINVVFCPTQPTGPWDFDKSTGLIRHSSQGKCVQASTGNKLGLAHCDLSNDNQLWQINQISTWK